MLNLSYFLTRAARICGREPKLFHGDAVSNYVEVNERVSRLASALSALGIERGARIGIVCDSEPRGLECLLAPLRAGMVLVPMNPKLHPAEHAYMLKNCEASALICGRPYRDGLLAVREKMPEGMSFIAMDENESSGSGVLDYDRLLSTGTPSFVDAEIKDGDLAWIFYTSGTTGFPKGAMLTQRNLLTMVETQLVEINQVRPSDRLAYVAPISHSAGLMAFQHVALGAGHVFPTYPRFNASKYYEMVERHRVTTTFMVPTMIQMLLDDSSHKGGDISSLHTIVYGGSPMYVDRLKEAVSTFGAIFVQLFAQGEAPMGCTVLPKLEHRTAGPVAERRLGSAGRECHHVEVRVVDQNDMVVPPNTSGEIVVRGDLVMKGYWNNPDASKETLRNGWLHTGDVGHMDEDGYLFITDRSKDVIITGGYNVYPRELEEILYSHESVQEATVFGVPDPKWIERVVAVVVVRKDCSLDEHELIELCRNNLASYKKPTEIRFVPELPKSNYGKILKRELRRQLYPSN